MAEPEYFINQNLFIPAV